MSEYKIHPSPQLVSLFTAKPYQGQDPLAAKVIILGNDANYSEEITNHEFFKYILEYHVDGVKFWKNHGVHHPFLLDEYPFPKNTGGVPYHRNFSKLGFSSAYADAFSFVELLSVPTIGNTSTDNNEFWKMLDVEHLKWLENIILDSSHEKIIFATRGVVERIREISFKINMFRWLSDAKVQLNALQPVYQNAGTTVYLSYSFSSSQIHNQLGEIKMTVQNFLSASSSGNRQEPHFADSSWGNRNNFERDGENNGRSRPTDSSAVNYSCPTCGSKNTKKISLIYSQGLSKSNRRSSGIGAIFGRYRSSLIGGTIWSEGNRQSKLSELTAPPLFYFVGEFVSAAICCYLIIPFALVLFGADQLMVSSWGATLFLIGALYMIFYDIFVYPSQKSLWRKSFVCLRCSTQYIPGGKILKTELTE